MNCGTGKVEESYRGALVGSFWRKSLWAVAQSYATKKTQRIPPLRSFVVLSATLRYNGITPTKPKADLLHHQPRPGLLPGYSGFYEVHT